MRTRRAQPAPPFDRAVAIGERDAIDGEQRRRRRHAEDRGADAVGSERRSFSCAFSIRTPNWVSKKPYIEPR